MHYASDLSFGAIAVLLRLSKSTVQTHHERALDHLLDALSYGQDL
jgi:DNA-directed RNA polymerase specialized sigma24 family protein